MTTITTPADLALTCCECRADFIWTAGERAFYVSRSLTQPRRCPRCRAQRKHGGKLVAVGIPDDSVGIPNDSA